MGQDDKARSLLPETRIIGLSDKCDTSTNAGGCTCVSALFLKSRPEERESVPFSLPSLSVVERAIYEISPRKTVTKRFRKCFKREKRIDKYREHMCPNRDKSVSLAKLFRKPHIPRGKKNKKKREEQNKFAKTPRKSENIVSLSSAVGRLQLRILSS